jgi:hypothetical protein
MVNQAQNPAAPRIISVTNNNPISSVVPPPTSIQAARHTPGMLFDVSPSLMRVLEREFGVAAASNLASRLESTMMGSIGGRTPKLQTIDSKTPRTPKTPVLDPKTPQIQIFNRKTRKTPFLDSQTPKNETIDLKTLKNRIRSLSNASEPAQNQNVNVPEGAEKVVRNQ